MKSVSALVVWFDLHAAFFAPFSLPCLISKVILSRVANLCFWTLVFFHVTCLTWAQTFPWFWRVSCFGKPTDAGVSFHNVRLLTGNFLATGTIETQQAVTIETLRAVTIETLRNDTIETVTYWHQNIPIYTCELLLLLFSDNWCWIFFFLLLTIH